MIRTICRWATFGPHSTEATDIHTLFATAPHSLGGDHADTAQ
ncbi:hypothetical protein BJ928_103239 [Rhizobium sp. WW_1]|jgi:hypothetical protein|nr:hypothetical protein BJ928_103239 [Rhizobium sp. WW_1]